MRRSIEFAVVLGLLASLLMGCGPSVSPTPTPTEVGPVTVLLMTHDSFNVSEEVIAEFEAEQGIHVKLLPSGDAGAALNQAILSKNNPLADVFFGVDNTFLSRALDAGIFAPYASPLLAEVPDSLELDAEHRLLPVVS